jgi:predicted aspartyl protease
VGKIITQITITNYIDRVLADRGFIPAEQIRSIQLDNVLVDTGANRLCLPADKIAELGLKLEAEIDIQIATGIQRARVFKDANITVCDRNGTFNCIELPAGQQPLLGFIPMEELGLEPDLARQTLRVLPTEGRETYLIVMKLSEDIC